MALKSANQPIRWLQRIGIFGILGIGYSAKQIETFVFDELLYGAVVAYITNQLGWLWGSLTAFAVMSLFTAAMCLGYVRRYVKTQTDLFGFEAIKELRDGLKVGGRWMRFVQRIIRLGDVPAFFAILLLHPSGDAFMATIYLRKGTGQYNGLTRRDRNIFGAAILVSNGYWTLRWTALVALVTEYFWPALIRPTLQWFGLA